MSQIPVNETPPLFLDIDGVLNGHQYDSFGGRQSHRGGRTLGKFPMDEVQQKLLAIAAILAILAIQRSREADKTDELKKKRDALLARIAEAESKIKEHRENTERNLAEIERIKAETERIRMMDSIGR